MRRMMTMLMVVAMITSASVVAWSCSYSSRHVLRALAQDPAVSAKAIAELRGGGASALEDVLAMRDMRREQLASAEGPRAESLRHMIDRLDQLIDEVGGAKYCSVSQLYWYTDFEQAQAEAVRLNRPIISLRMLGHLDEEFSCANSRFFRTTLYANADISQTLRQKFVLHWESVRPVPKVTIDFGDGRTLERTLTGNSIHYVVDPSGRPLDGLPGLHGPQAFQNWLAQAETLAHSYAAAPQADRQALLQTYHQERLAAVSAELTNDLARINGVAGVVVAAPAPAPSARDAALIARPKRAIEMPIIRQVAAAPALPESIDELDETTWSQLAALHLGETQLDEASVALIRSENPSVVLAGQLSVSKAVVEDPLARLVRNFRSSIALDTVRNEYVLHRKLHQWFAKGEVDSQLWPLNDRVYAELFLTPSSDPWLGLMTADTYTALMNNGVKMEQTIAVE